MSNIIDTIQVSGVTYTIAGSGSGNSVVEVTQAQYDALVSGGTVDPTILYIITDAQAGDLTQYWTSAQTQSAITEATSGKVDTSDFNTYSASVETALSGKQDTLVSGTNIKTINNESLLGSGNITIQGGGGGGKAIEAGRGISITTGETADTVSFNLPISAGTGDNALLIASDTYDISNKAKGNYSVSFNGGGLHPNYAYGTSSLAQGMDTKAYGNACHSEGYGSKAGVQNNINIQYSHAEGNHTEAKGTASHAEGFYTIANNLAEHASGQYNNSVSASTTFGDSGNTLFSVGNGTANNARHNALEIRQNGDIYITLDGQDVKLQDQLGGGSITVDDMLSSTSTNPVQNKVVKSATDRICKLFGYGTSGQTDILAWATGATSAVIDDYVQFSKINGKKIIGNGVSPTDNFSLVETSAITSSITSSSTDAQVPSAKAVYESVSGKVDTSSMSGYVTTNTKQEITGSKTFIGSSSTSEKPIIFKQVNDNHKIGFVCRNTASTNNELATFEFRPNTFTIDNVKHPLLYFGHYRTTNTANAGVPQTVIGFRQYDQLNNAAYHYLIPLPEKAKTPFSLTTSFKDYYAPMGFKNGSTMITADETGVVDLSSEFGGKADTATTYTKTEVDNAITAATSTKQDTLVSGTNIKTINNESILGSGNITIQGGGGVTIDPSLDSGSTNAVANSAITEAIMVGEYTLKTKIPDEIQVEPFQKLLVEPVTSGAYADTTFLQIVISGNNNTTDNLIVDSFSGHTIGATPTYLNCTWLDDNYLLLTPKNNSNYITMVIQMWNTDKNVYSIENLQSGSSSSIIENTIFPKIEDINYKLNTKVDTYISGTSLNNLYNDYGGYWYHELKMKDNTNRELGWAQKMKYSDFGLENDCITVKRTSAVTSASTSAETPSAKAVYDAIPTTTSAVTSGSTAVVESGAVYSQLGGLKLVKLTQAEYDNLSTKDSNTLYVIVN